MDDEILLIEVLHQGDPVYMWDFIPIIDRDGQENVRVFYKPDEKLGGGVKIFVLEFSSTYTRLWDPEGMWVNVIYEASCYFDGLRHLYVASHDDGYLYCVNMLTHIEIYKTIQSLIEKYCRDWNN